MITKNEIQYLLQFLSLNGKIGMEDILIYINNTSNEEMTKAYRLWKEAEAPEAPDIVINDNLDWYSIFT